jgi:hypothetical protein
MNRGFTVYTERTGQECNYSGELFYNAFSTANNTVLNSKMADER